MALKPGGVAIPRSLMASFLSSLFLLKPYPFPNQNTNARFIKPARFSIKADRGSSRPPPSPPTAQKKSLAVATGELFLGLASRLIWASIREPEVLASERKVDLRGERGESIAKVVEDTAAGEDVIWEQREKDVEAEKERKKVTSPGFSFSAAGLLFPYHLGVAQCLLEKGYIKETTPLAGSSAGAIVCAVIASGSRMQDALQITKVLAEDCRLKGTAFRLGAVLREILNEFLPEDVHVRCNGRIRVAITELFWRPQGLLADQFDSKEDLINAVFSSSFIPGYLAPIPATMFRNRLCIDGALTLFMPPTSASKTVHVCAFPLNRIGLTGIGISPDCNPDNRATPIQLFYWAVEPAGDEILDKFYEHGYLDAAVWADQNPIESTVVDESNPCNPMSL